MACVERCLEVCILNHFKVKALVGRGYVRWSKVYEKYNLFLEYDYVVPQKAMIVSLILGQAVHTYLEP